MRCRSRSAILLNVGLVNFIFFQLRNEEGHDSVTVPLGVESLRGKNGSDYVPTRYSNPNANRQVHRDFLITLYNTIQ